MKVKQQLSRRFNIGNDIGIDATVHRYLNNGLISFRDAAESYQTVEKLSGGKVQSIAVIEMRSKAHYVAHGLTFMDQGIVAMLKTGRSIDIKYDDIEAISYVELE